MTKPVRLRLSRADGFDLQGESHAINGLAAVKVDRATRWGNPYRMPVSAQLLSDKDRFAVALGIVEDFRNWLYFSGRVRDLSKLRGKNLACWCRLDQPCHADVLLELANQ